MKKCLLLGLFGGVLLTGCQNELYKDANDFQSEQGCFMVNKDPVITYVKESEAKLIENVQLGLVKKESQEVQVNLKVCDQSVLDKYNAKNGTDYVLLPESMYEMESSVLFKSKETRTSVPVKIKDNLSFSEKGTYALPISINTGNVNIIAGEKETMLVLEPINYKKVFKLKKGRADIEDFNMFPKDFKVDQWTIEAMVKHSFYVSKNVSVCGTRLAGDNDTMDEIYPRFGDVTIEPNQFQLKTASTQIDVPAEKFTAKNDEWYMMSLVYDGQMNYIYMNGVLVAAEKLRTGPYGMVGFWIGGRNEWIREVRLWKTARTQSQIQSTLWKGVNPDNDDLLLYYPLDGRKLDRSTGEVTDDASMIWDWSKSEKHLAMPSEGMFDDNGGDLFQFPPTIE